MDTFGYLSGISGNWRTMKVQIRIKNHFDPIVKHHTKKNAKHALLCSCF